MSFSHILQYVLAIFVFSRLALPAIAQPAATQQADDHAALRAIVPLYEQAVNQGNPALLQPYLDPEFTGVMVTGESVEGFDSLQAYWTKIKNLIGSDGSYRVKVNVAAPAIIDGDLAIAHGTTDDVVHAKGRDMQFTSAWTAVCRKSVGQWKLLRIHSAMDPVDNVFVHSSVTQASLLAAAIAGIAGLIVGAILVAILKGRSGARRPTAV